MPDSPTEEEASAVTKHFRYLKEACDNGRLTLAGRTLEPPYIGIAIFEAEDQADADLFAKNDPAVAACVFRLKAVQPYAVALLRTNSDS